PTQPWVYISIYPYNEGHALYRSRHIPFVVRYVAALFFRTWPIPETISINHKSSTGTTSINGLTEARLRAALNNCSIRNLRMLVTRGRGRGQVAIVISLVQCPPQGHCPDPTQLLGNTLYVGPFNPEYPKTRTPQNVPQQNFTVTVPDSFKTNTKALLTVAHISLVGVSNSGSGSGGGGGGVGLGFKVVQGLALMDWGGTFIKLFLGSLLAETVTFFQAGPYLLTEIKNVTVTVR
ncbi:hypothetical protein B0F90DRAFT_1778608, partial [Multifurca ochricompacta]